MHFLKANLHQDTHMKLTSDNLARHVYLFAETGPNRAVVVRERSTDTVDGHRDVRAEAYKLLENDIGQEGWVRVGPYCDDVTITVDDLLAKRPELGRYHFIPGHMIDLW